MLVVATFFAAGGERVKRIAAAFDWRGVVTPANFRVDAWVTPPAYTGRPPLMLPGLRPGEHRAAPAATGGGAGRQSILVVRATGNVGLDVGDRRRHRRRAGRCPPQRCPSGTEERRFTITATGAATVRGAAAT